LINFISSQYIAYDNATRQ